MYTISWLGEIFFTFSKSFIFWTDSNSWWIAWKEGLDLGSVWKQFLIKFANTRGVLTGEVIAGCSWWLRWLLEGDLSWGRGLFEQISPKEQHLKGYIYRYRYYLSDIIWDGIKDRKRLRLRCRYRLSYTEMPNITLWRVLSFFNRFRGHPGLRYLRGIEGKRMGKWI